MSNKPYKAKQPVFDSAKELVIEGVNLYKRLKPLLKKERKVKNQNDQSNITNK